jgi:hypothetical protein
MTMGAEDDWRLGEPALRSAGVVWSDVVVNVSRQRVSGAEMGIADPRLNLEVEGERADRICFVLKLLMRSSIIIYRKREGIVVDVETERAMVCKLNRFSTSTCLRFLLYCQVTTKEHTS